MHSIMVSEKYDVDQVGQHYLFTNPDNVFLSLKRMENLLMTYRRQTRLDYTLELANNFSVKASANLERQEANLFRLACSDFWDSVIKSSLWLYV